MWHYRRWRLVLLISQVISVTQCDLLLYGRVKAESHVWWIWAFTQPSNKRSHSYFLYWTNHKHICFSSISSLSMPVCESLYTHTHTHHQNEKTFGYFGCLSGSFRCCSFRNDILNSCNCYINPLNAELNPICCLLALLGAHHFLHVSRIRVKSLILRLLMSYIYGAPILDVSRSHTTTHHSR